MPHFPRAMTTIPGPFHKGQARHRQCWQCGRSHLELTDLKYSGLGSEGTQEASGNTGSEVHRLLPICVDTRLLRAWAQLEPGSAGCSVKLPAYVLGEFRQDPSVEEGCILDGPGCPERPLRSFRGSWDYPSGL